MTDTTPLYLREFPDFGPLDIAIPPGFVDTSWHNDACPSWTHEGLGLKLWINFENPDWRDIDSAYMLTDCEGAEPIDERSNSFDRITETILLYKIAQRYVALATLDADAAQIADLKAGRIGLGDICDDNEAMAEAVESHGISLWGEDGHMTDEAVSIWNNAFAVAMNTYVPRLPDLGS